MLQKTSIFIQVFKSTILKQVTIHTDYITLIVLDYGAIIQKILVKDKDGKSTNVVLGLNYPKDYLKDTRHIGACVGRYAGRISDGGFQLNNKAYLLHTDDGVHLHGGKEGFSKKYWTIQEVNRGAEPFVKLSYISKHLEEGYPGNLKAMVTYKLVNNALHIIHEATTDYTTVVNLTNHSYFKLDDAPTVNNYQLQLNCPKLLQTYKNLIPTGKLLSVENSSYDFTWEKKIKTVRLDTPYVIDSKTKKVGTVYSEKSGIYMEVTTDQPGVVIYTPENENTICFETQNYPDAPNHDNFPSSVLEPGEVYCNSSSFIFGVD